jgi:isopentenyldiphosphate isomerase
MHPKLSIAYFVTSHGFGHAARASAVMNAIFVRWPFVHFEIFTLTPKWFFNNSLNASYTYHLEHADVGLMQTSPLHFDLGRTINALDEFLPFDEMRLESLADKLAAAQCHLVISDISPLGIAVAHHAGIPSVLVENFTWDWIYEPYASKDTRFNKHIDLLSGYYDKAGLRIQAAPVCGSQAGNIGGNLLCTTPISRGSLIEPRHTRERLGIPEKDKMVLITNGGIPGNLLFEKLEDIHQDVWVVNPGTSVNGPVDGPKKDNVIFLPQNSSFYHPDLVHASDAVIGKVGYSTLAEVYHAGVPYGFIPRPGFRESRVMESYIAQNMAGIEIPEAALNSGGWLKNLLKLLQLPVQARKEPNGADMAAQYICRYLACEKEILDVVDIQGCVVGAAPRHCIHGNNQLIHQVVHVLVFDNANRLLLQKRSMDKRVAPGRWDTSVGGHVDCGEPVEKAMYREMNEELGIRPQSLQFIYQYIHSNDFESELVFTYICQYEGKIVFNPEEIVTVKFWTMEEIEASLGKGILSDNFEDEFKRFQRWQKQRKTE